MLPALRALRPQEWIKNLLVYAGPVFSGRADELSALVDASLAFAAFCAMSSAGYLLNDLRDREHDRRHPDKRNRPVASGAVSTSAALAMAVALALAGLALGAAADPEIAGLVALYGAITTAYSLVLKRVVILDVMTIASLFILRVVAGAVAVDGTASEFLLVCTAMLALFLGFTKRRQEAMLELGESATGRSPSPDESESGFDEAAPRTERPARHPAGSVQDPAAAPGATRPVLEHYSLPFLDQMVAMVTAAAILSYVIYAVDSPIAGSDMLITAPAVLFGIFRYLYLIYHRHDTQATSSILTRDPGMIGAAVVYLASAVLVLYVF